MVIAQAQVLQRTVPAARRAVGQAYGCAKLHQRLIEIARPIRGHPCGKAFARLLFFIPGIRDRCEIVIQPRGNAQHVSIHRGNGNPIGDRRDRAGRVFADAGKRKQLVIIRGKLAAVFLAEYDSGRGAGCAPDWVA